MNQHTIEQIEKLAGKIRQSDKPAFDELFRLMYPQLLRFATSYTRDKSAAYDVVQDAFINLWQKRAGIDPSRSLKSYMYMIVRNRAINMIQSRMKVIVDSELTEHQLPSDTNENESDTHQQQHLNGTVREWIDELPERQREAFELSRFEGLSHEEIATVMDISAKTVNNHIFAAINQLRKNYQQYKT